MRSSNGLVFLLRAMRELSRGHGDILRRAWKHCLKGVAVVRELQKRAQTRAGGVERMNRWNIPSELESEVLARDMRCVYCGVEFTVASARRHRPSWEHIVNDVGIVNRDNIARCCMGCNASKGARPLAAWLTSKYCESRGITSTSVAQVVRAALGAGGRRGSRSGGHREEHLITARRVAYTAPTWPK